MIGDWGDAAYAASQIFITITHILLMCSYFITGRRLQLATSITANSMGSLSYALLGGWVGVAMCLTGIARDAVSYVIYWRRAPSDAGKISGGDWWFLALWVSLTIGTGLATMSGLLSLTSMLAALVYTISIWHKNPAVYRLLGILAAALWMGYNLHVGSIMGAVFELGIMTSSAVGLILYLRRAGR